MSFPLSSNGLLHAGLKLPASGMSYHRDTIAAVATPPGRGGIGVVRVSGQNLEPFFQDLLKGEPQPRHATFCNFLGADNSVIDQGIALYFPAPNSFTGEDVLELQGHGGPVVMDQLLQRCLELGARVANPGEFSERAFLNDKIDLTQAEAIADLIDASSVQAASGAMRSLQGEFSRRVHGLVEQVTRLRMYVEAAIDFPEEEIDFLSEGRVAADLAALVTDLDTLLQNVQQGSLMSEGMTIVLAGKPNSGKSSLLNALSGRDTAIVTDVAGTTRDVLREQVHIDGMPLHIVDTAGLRSSDDNIEKEGIRRAWLEIEKADRVLFVIDSSRDYSLAPRENWPDYFERFPDSHNITLVLNKTDLSGLPEQITEGEFPVVSLSARRGNGLENLIGHLKVCMGYSGAGEGSFTARRRHLNALEQAGRGLQSAVRQLHASNAGELVAEDLRQVQQHLSVITGAFTADDLLGEIFSSFCIGK